MDEITTIEPSKFTQQDERASLKAFFVPTILVALVHPDFGSCLSGIEDAEDVRLVCGRERSAAGSRVATPVDSHMTDRRGHGLRKKVTNSSERKIEARRGKSYSRIPLDQSPRHLSRLRRLHSTYASDP